MIKVAILLALLARLVLANANIWDEAANEINVDPYLLWSIGKNESGFNAYSINYNKMPNEKIEKAAFFFRTNGVKTQRYGNEKQHLSVDCKNLSCAETAIAYAEKNKINYDIGVMNINSIHFKTLSEYGITPYSLLDPKLNVKVGAWELKGCINRYGYSWNAINCYNGMSYENRVQNKYAMKIYKTMMRAKQRHQAPQNAALSEGASQPIAQSEPPSFLAFEKVN